MNDLKDIGKAIDLVKRTPNSERTALINGLLASRIDVGPPIPGFDPRGDTLPKGNVRLCRPGWNRKGAEVLGRRALFVSALSEQNLWP